MDIGLKKKCMYGTEQLLVDLEVIFDRILTTGLLTHAETEEAFLLINALRKAAYRMGFEELAEITYKLEVRLEQRLEGLILDSEEIRKFIDNGYKFTEYYRSCLNALSEGKSIPQMEGALFSSLVCSGKNKDSEIKKREIKVEPVDISKYYIINVRFKDCAMMAMRAFVAVKAVKSLCESCYSVPADLVDDRSSALIKENGLTFAFIPEEGVVWEDITDKISKQAFFDFWELMLLPEGEAFKKG